MYTQKDLNRINGIVIAQNPTAAAYRMANLITNADKALQRGRAAISVGCQAIAEIFFSKARQLGIDVDAQLARPSRKLGSQLPEADRFHTNRQAYHGGSPILPCGKLNLRTGNNKYFNVRDNGESPIEVWSDLMGNHRFVITSGSNPIFPIGKRNNFVHDQTGRDIFAGEMVDYINSDSMEMLIENYGSCFCYVYK